MINGLSYKKDAGNSTEISLNEANQKITEGEIVWFDAVNPTSEELAQLSAIFKLHELAIEDSISAFHLPKVDEYDNHIYLIWHALQDEESTPMIDNFQVNIFLGDKFIITTHEAKLSAIDAIFKKAKTGDFLSEGLDWVLHGILDSFVDAYFPIIDKLSNEIDLIEDKVFKNPDKKEMRNLFVIKHKLREIKKIVAPQRDMISEITRFGDRFINQNHIVYFRDVFDHLIRIVDLVETSRDAVSGIVDIYLSSISNKMNEIMTRLTIVATIFMPLTLITGVYGMNFRYMPELQWRYSYFFVWIIILSFGFGSYYHYKKKMKW